MIVTSVRGPADRRELLQGARYSQMRKPLRIFSVGGQPHVTLCGPTASREVLGEPWEPRAVPRHGLRLVEQLAAPDGVLDSTGERRGGVLVAPADFGYDDLDGYVAGRLPDVANARRGLEFEMYATRHTA